MVEWNDSECMDLALGVIRRMGLQYVRNVNRGEELQIADA